MLLVTGPLVALNFYFSLYIQQSKSRISIYCKILQINRFNALSENKSILWWIFHWRLVSIYLFVLSQACVNVATQLHQMFLTYEHRKLSLLLLKPLCACFIQNMLCCFFNIQIFLYKNVIISSSSSSLRDINFNPPYVAMWEHVKHNPINISILALWFCGYLAQRTTVSDYILTELLVHMWPCSFITDVKDAILFQKGQIIGLHHAKKTTKEIS